MEVEMPDVTESSCRLCLVPITNAAVDLYAEQLIEMVESVFRITFVRAKWFPQMICKDCQALVLQIHDYMQKVRANQDYLQSVNSNLPKTRSAEVKTESDSEQKYEPTIEQPKSPETKPIEDKEENDQLQPSEEDAGNDDYKEHSIEEVIPKRRRKIKKTKSTDETRAKEEELIKRYYTFRCDVCSKETTNFKALLDHFRESHKTSGYIKCCNKKLYRRCRLLDHISKHQDPDTFRCEICNKTYACRTSLELHNMHLHLSENEKPHKCSVCSKSFAKDYQLKCHMVRHVAVECPKCGRILSNRLSLRDHLINVHSEVGQKQSVCDICGKGFRSKVSFQRHVLMHQGAAPDNRVQCHLCPRWLTNKMGLQKHIRTQHMEIGNQFVCGDCGKISPNSSALQQHRRVVHAEEKFSCEVCGKRFKRAITLKEHRAIHTGEKLYSCRFCPMTFISNANMYSHQKKMHPDEWEKARVSKLKK